MRRVRVLRKIFHVQRDVMFTMVLLLFFCLLLYTQQVSTHRSQSTGNAMQGNAWNTNTLLVIVSLNQ